MFRAHRPLISTCFALILMLVGLPSLRAQKTNPDAFSASWTLNVAASTNPNGPAPAAIAAARGGGRPRGAGGDAPAGGGGGAAGGGGDDEGGGRVSGGAAGGSLGVEEKARFYAMLGVLVQAPPTLDIAATAKDVTLTPAGRKPMTQTTDNKKVDVPTGAANFGSLEIRAKWDGAALHRETKTIDGLTIIETYAVNPDGKQMTVTVELKSQVERLADALRVPVKRVYDKK